MELTIEFSAEIPSERQDARVITPWEATAAYDLYQWKSSREVHFAADGGCWCLSARTLLIRASILRDQSFADAYTRELIGGRVVNTADDVFLTRWVFDRVEGIYSESSAKLKLPPTFPATVSLRGRCSAGIGEFSPRS